MNDRHLLAGVALAFACGCSGSTGSPSQTGSGGTATSARGIGGGNNSSGDVSKGGGPNSSSGGSSPVVSADAGGAPNASTSSSRPLGAGGTSAGGTSTANSALGSSPGNGGASNSTALPSQGGDGPANGGTSTTKGGAAPTVGGSPSAGGKTNTAAPGGGAGSGGKSNTGGSTAVSGTAPNGGKSNNGGANSSTTSTTGCSRDLLQAAVDSYLDAIKAGNAASLPSSLKYTENGATVALGSGLWSTPLTIDLLPPLTALDVEKCQAYIEVIVNNDHPYVFGARISVTASSGQISAIGVLATDCDDWGFNAATYLQYSKQEQQSGGWGPVAEADRLSRTELQAAGDAYFAYWGDKTVEVPWGTPCARLEGGMYTGGGTSGSCNVGIPDQSFAPKANDYLIDADDNMAVLFLNMPGPDSHWFRVNKSGIRYIHTLTVCYVNGTWQCPGTQPTCK